MSDLWDSVRLQMLLESKPECVLKLFKRHQVLCLMQLPAYQRIRTSNPMAAQRIVCVAATLGIPEEGEGR